MEKIVIIKLGAKGDVVRTLPILKAIKQKYPDSEIHWITKKSSSQILENIPEIKKLYSLPDYPDEEFDILYNLDIEDEATSLALKISAKQKYGFHNESGFVQSFNFPAEYYLNTLFDDELKKSNKKNYQEMMFETAELPYNKEHYRIPLTEKAKEYAEEFLKKNNITQENLIGIHLGASSRWPSKVWHEDNLKEFIKTARNNNYEILLFGGPNEIESHKKIVDDLINHGIKIYQNNPLNTDQEFFSLVNLCNAMICSDSFGLHIPIAFQKPTIGLFFCTPPNEVEDYGILKKISSPMLKDFFPEKMDQYSEELVKSISPEKVLEVLKEIFPIK